MWQVKEMELKAYNRFFCSSPCCNGHIRTSFRKARRIWIYNYAVSVLRTSRMCTTLCSFIRCWKRAICQKSTTGNREAAH
jgi:hypothetical protein